MKVFLLLVVLSFSAFSKQRIECFDDKESTEVNVMVSFENDLSKGWITDNLLDFKGKLSSLKKNRTTIVLKKVTDFFVQSALEIPKDIISLETESDTRFEAEYSFLTPDSYGTETLWCTSVIKN